MAKEDLDHPNHQHEQDKEGLDSTQIDIPKDHEDYWTGTSQIQKEESSRRFAKASAQSSMRRQSIQQIQQDHGSTLDAMREAFPKASVHELVRFLRARKYNLEKANKMYQAHLDWRQSYLPTIDKEKAEKTLATRKFYLLDHLDGEGHPVMYYCFHRFQDMGYDVENELAALVYLFEDYCIPRFGPSLEQQKFTVLIDVSGIRSPPLSFLKHVNSVMEANYPETLHRTIMFPVPYWLQKIIKSFLVFVDPDTRDKFAYVNDIKSLEDFAQLKLEQMGPDIAELIQKKQLKK